MWQDLELLATKMQLLTRRLVDAEAAKSEALGRIVEVNKRRLCAGGVPSLRVCLGRGEGYYMILAGSCSNRKI